MRSRYSTAEDIKRPWMHGKRYTNVVPEGEHGHLTPLRPASSGGGLWLWQCRCGAVESRMSKDVRRAVGLGRTPKCQGCMHRSVAQPGARSA